MLLRLCLYITAILRCLSHFSCISIKQHELKQGNGKEIIFSTNYHFNNYVQFQSRLQPRSQSMSRLTDDDACWQCGINTQANGDELLFCEKCQTARYCSRQCQLQSHQSHKILCQQIYNNMVMYH